MLELICKRLLLANTNPAAGEQRWCSDCKAAARRPAIAMAGGSATRRSYPARLRAG